MKKQLQGKKCTDDEKVKTTILPYLEGKNFFFINKLTKRSEKCIRVKSEYIERKHNHFFLSFFTFIPQMSWPPLYLYYWQSMIRSLWISKANYMHWSAPFIRDLSIHRFWYPQGDLEPILWEYWGTTKVFKESNFIWMFYCVLQWGGVFGGCIPNPLPPHCSRVKYIITLCLHVHSFLFWHLHYSLCFMKCKDLWVSITP